MCHSACIVASFSVARKIKTVFSIPSVWLQNIFFYSCYFWCALKTTTKQFYTIEVEIVILNSFNIYTFNGFMCLQCIQDISFCFLFQLKCIKLHRKRFYYLGIHFTPHRFHAVSIFSKTFLKVFFLRKTHNKVTELDN